MPAAEESSAYHTCLALEEVLRWLINGTVAKVYIGIASGSLWVVPSVDRSVLSPTNSSVALLYVLIKTVAIGGHTYLMLWRGHFLFRELNALDASTIRTALVSSEVRQALMKCMAASIPAI